MGSKELLSINRDNAPRFGDLLVPKRGRHIDPVIVIQVSPGDKQVVVKDQKLVEADPKWTEGNKLISPSPENGCVRMTFRDAGKNFYVDAQRRKANLTHAATFMRSRGWSIPDSWFE